MSRNFFYMEEFNPSTLFSYQVSFYHTDSPFYYIFSGKCGIFRPITNIYFCLVMNSNKVMQTLDIKHTGLIGRVFANGPGDWGSIPGRVIPKTQKMVFDASLLNTQHYKVWIKGKVEQYRERSSAFLYSLV